MDILITHLTRMRPGYICVAGLDLDTGGHVRPLDGQLRTGLLERNGGYFDLGNIINLGPVKRVGMPPEVEDVRFQSGRARKTTQASYKSLWELIGASRVSSLREIFGYAIWQEGRTCVVDERQGVASLGVLAPGPSFAPVLRIDEYAKPRLRFATLEWPVTVPVNDLRLYEPDHKTPRYNRIAYVTRQLERKVPCLLSVGLTRLYRGHHWLQVNNIFLEEDVNWRDFDRLQGRSDA